MCHASNSYVVSHQTLAYFKSSCSGPQPLYKGILFKKKKKRPLLGILCRYLSLGGREQVGIHSGTIMSSSTPPSKSQYQHFVPRFILKNFAHLFQPPTEPSPGSKKKRQGRRKKTNGHYPGDPMLNVINLAGATPNIVETPVAKTLGMTDMYRDLRHGANQNHLEEKFSKLESQAGTVISKVRKAFEAGDRDVWITRSERDTLRKFLFIMKYRSSGFYERYHHSDAEGYSSDDRERLLDYMRKKGYKKPVDVWVDNINAMLALKMDPQMKWMEWLREHAYPDDAMWFIAHCQMMYLALCTPSKPDDEFLLTENAYNIHEGPVSYFLDPVTKQMRPGSYTEFHMFSVISPKLMIVLRSCVLPVPEEDADEDTRTWRRNAFEQIAAQHNDPLNVRSMLEDLPISKARNTYTKIVDGKVVLLDGEDGLHRTDHKFCFRFFPISTEHTDRLNFIMLENAYHVSTIVFKSRQAAARTLKEYLTVPCELNGSASFKMIAGSGDDQRLNFLRTLEKIVSDLGSEVVATYQIDKGKFYDPLVMAGQWLKASVPIQNEPTDFTQLYAKLGVPHIFIKSTSVTDNFDRWRPHNAAQGHGSSSQDAQHEDQDRCLVQGSQQQPTRGHASEAGEYVLPATCAAGMALCQTCKVHASFQTRKQCRPSNRCGTASG